MPRRVAGLVAATLVATGVTASSNPSYRYGYPPSREAQPVPERQAAAEYDDAAWPGEAEWSQEAEWPQEPETRSYGAGGPPYTVDRSDLRRTVETPYSSGQALRYRGRMVHRQQDFRPAPAPTPAARAGQPGVAAAGVPAAVHNLLGQVQGPFIGVIFAYYAWRTIERYSGVMASESFANHRGLYLVTVVPTLVTLLVCNLACAALGFLSARGQKSKLKVVINLDGAVDFIMLISNVMMLVVSPVAMRKQRSDTLDALVVNMMSIVVWRSVTRVCWF